MTAQPALPALPKPRTPTIPPGRSSSRWPNKTAYRILRRLTGRGRCRPWLDLTVCELFEAEAAGLRQVARMPRALTARLATADDAVELGDFYGCAALVERRLCRGDVCATVLAGGRIGAAAWLLPGPAVVEEDRDDLGCLYRIPSGVAWGYDGRGTKPGAWGCLMARLPAFLAQLGAERIVASIHYNNRLSIASHRSAGFRTLGWIGCARLLGFTVRRYRPAEGRWHRLPGPLGPVEVLL